MKNSGNDVVYIPDYLKNKSIPKNNENPLCRISKTYELNHFIDLTLDILKTVYKKEKTLFWNLVKQIAFYGVRFKNKLSKYNYVHSNDISVLYTKQRDEFIDYNMLDNYVFKNQLVSFGLIKIQDMDGVSLEAIENIKPKDIKVDLIKQFIKEQGFELVTPEEYCNYTYKISNKSKIRNEVRENRKQLNFNLSFDSDIKTLYDEINCYKENNFDIEDRLYFIQLLMKKLKEVDVNRLIKNIILNKNGDLLLNEIKDYLSVVGINISVKELQNNIKQLLKKSSKFNLIDFNEKTAIILSDYIKDLLNDGPLCLVDLKMKLELEDNWYFCLFSALKKINNIGLNKKRKICLTNNLNARIRFCINSALTKIKRLKNKKIDNLIKNLFINLETPLLLKEIKKYLMFLNIDLSLEEIDELLRNNADFKLIDVNKWSLDSWDEYPEFNEEFKSTWEQILSSFPEENRERDIDILNKRIFSNDYTLEKLGEEHSISRQRVRQLEESGMRKLVHYTRIKYIKPFLSLIENLFIDRIIISYNEFDELRKKYFLSLNINEVINFFNTMLKSEKKGVSFSNIISEVEYKLRNIEDKFISKRPLKNILGLINKIINEYFENNEVKYEKLSKLLRRNGIKDKKVIDELLKVNNDTLKIENMVYFINNAGKDDKCALILKEFFSNGVNISKKNDEIKALLNKYFPLDFKESSNRSITGNIQRSNKIINWGRGDYIHIDNVHVIKDDLIQVKNWLKERLNSDLIEIWANAAYREFKQYLKDLGIPNQHALYSLLEFYFGDEFHFYKSPRILPLSSKGTEPKQNSDVIEEYLLNVGRKVSKGELKKYFIEEMGWEDYTLSNHLSQAGNVIECNDGIYVHREYLQIDIEKLNQIADDLDNILEQNNSIISVSLIYDNKRVTVMSANISSEKELYNYLETIHSDRFSFPFYPVIATKNYSSIQSKKDIFEEYFSKCNTSIFYNELKNKFKKLGFELREIYYGVSRSEDIIPLKKGHEYIYKDKLALTEEKKKYLQDLVLELLDASQRHYISISRTILNNKNRSKLPNLGNSVSWREDLLVYFLSNMNKFLLLGTKDYVVMKKNNKLEIKDDSDFIAYILKNKFNGATKLKKIENFLSRINFISHDLAKSHTEEVSLYEIDNGEIIHKDLLDRK
ncbi:sigma-70 region 4 domain protein [Acetohalobium arabaticum DSM 5501]|uniref:Sigma-70 region 4 domain protein n=2 Tax=Acetohalobium TaxID=28186 RepID=D9QVC8_ACEAZ|nr:sigma-70 region 4 domain protein [Acetohalobium arabaticum DSM 5501]